MTPAGSLTNLEQDTDPITAPEGMVGPELEDNAFTFESLLDDKLRTAMEKKQDVAKPISAPKYDTGLDDLSDEDEIKRQKELNEILGLDKKEENSGEEDDRDTETPYWEDFDEYKKLKLELQGYGYSTEVINKVIEKAVEKKSLDNNVVLKNLNDQIVEREKKLKDYQLAVDRASKVEKNLYFDNSEYAQANYHIPGKKLKKEVADALAMEGAEGVYEAVLQSDNKAQALAALKDYDIDQDTLTVVLDKWKQYKILHRQYDADKAEAQKDLGNALKTKLPQQVIDSISTEVIHSLLDDEEFEDLSTAVKSQNKEYLQGVVGTAKTNFESILAALADPTKAVTDKEWLRNVFGVYLDAAHKTEAFNNFQALKTESQSDKHKIEILTQELLRIREADGGISKKGRPPAPIVTSSNGSNGQSAQEPDINVEKAKRLFKGDLDIDELLKNL